MRCLGSLVICALTLGACGGTEKPRVPVTQVTEPVLLRYRAAVGDRFQYRSDSKMWSGSEHSVDFGMTLSYKCVGVTSGTTTYEMTMSDITSMGTGNYAKMGDDLKEIEGIVCRAIYDKRGQVISLHIGDVEVPPDGLDTSHMLLPEKPVKSGDSWESPVTSDGLKATMTYTLEGIQMVNGKKLYRVTGEFLGKQPLRADPVYEVLLDPETLRFVTMTGGFAGTQERVNATFKARQL